MRIFWLGLAATFLLLHCQRPEPETGIPFLPHNPEIDGQLDAGLLELPKQTVPHNWSSDNPVADTLPFTYRMAYTPTHLYLYIEAETAALHSQNRRFNHRDEFKLLLGLPQANGPLDKHYELVFSALEGTRYPERKRIWKYNAGQREKHPLSEESLFREVSVNGKFGFEALIAWADVPPCHPWFTERMGYYLYFAKTVEDTTANGYAVVPDMGIRDEELAKRAYKSLSFQSPQPTSIPLFFMQPEQRHIDYRSPLIIKGVSLAAEPGDQTVEVAILKGMDAMVWQGQFALPCGKRLREAAFALPTERMAPGLYELVLAPTETASDTLSFVIFPPLDYQLIRKTLKENQLGHPPGRVKTLLSMLGEIERRRKALSPYEAGEDLYGDILSFEEAYEAFRNGKASYASQAQRSPSNQ